MLFSFFHIQSSNMVVVLFCKSPMKKIIIMNRERSWGGAATQKAANNKCIKKRERERERERERKERYLAWSLFF
jgi:hypothetical protein